MKRFLGFLIVLFATIAAGCSSSENNPALVAAGKAGSISAADSAPPKVQLLNVSYDPTREFYSEFNASFAQYWQQQKGQEGPMHTRR